MAVGWRLATSLETLRSEINTAYPKRSKASDGTIGNDAHAATASDHNPNSDNVVCGMDITNDPANGLDAHALADRLITNRNPNLKYVISNSRIASVGTAWRWVKYTGANKHNKHIHISVGVGADGKSKQPYDGTQPWNIKLTGGTDMPLTPQQQDRALKMGLRREPTAAELTNKQWQNDPGLLIDTVWNNGGSKSYEAVKQSQIVKADIDNLLKDAGITPTQADYDALKKNPKDLIYYIQTRLKSSLVNSKYELITKPVYVKK